jgi:IS30 family transposase
LSKWAGIRDIAELAALFGKCERTIKRELARGWVTLTNSDLTERETYSWYLAQEKAKAEKKSHGPAEKIGKALASKRITPSLRPFPVKSGKSDGVRTR